MTEHVRVGPLWLLGRAVANPLVVLLSLLAGAAVAGGDLTSAVYLVSAHLLKTWLVSRGWIE